MGQACSQNNNGGMGDLHRLSYGGSEDLSSPQSRSKGQGQGQEKNSVALHRGAVLGLASSRMLAANQVFSCSDDKTIARHEWDRPPLSTPDAAATAAIFTGHQRAVNRIAVDGKRGWLWSASRDLSLRQWRLNEGHCLRTYANAHELNLSAVALNADGDGTYVYTGSRDYAVKQWDVATGRNVASFSTLSNIVTAMAIGAAASGSGSAELVYQCAEDLRVRVWDPRMGSGKSPALEILGFVYFALCMDLHRDGNLLATGCKGFNGVGCEVKVWDLRATGRPVSEHRGHSQDVTACKYLYHSDARGGCSGDGGSTLVSCSKDGSVFAWPGPGPGGSDSSSVSPTAAAPTAQAQLQTSKMYTSLAALYPGAGAGKGAAPWSLDFCAGAFDGSVQRLALRNSQTPPPSSASPPGLEREYDLEVVDCTSPYFFETDDGGEGGGGGEGDRGSSVSGAATGFSTERIG